MFQATVWRRRYRRSGFASAWNIENTCCIAVSGIVGLPVFLDTDKRIRCIITSLQNRNTHKKTDDSRKKLRLFELKWVVELRATYAVGLLAQHKYCKKSISFFLTHIGANTWVDSCRMTYQKTDDQHHKNRNYYKFEKKYHFEWEKNSIFFLLKWQCQKLKHFFRSKVRNSHDDYSYGSSLLIRFSCDIKMMCKKSINRTSRL